MLIFWVLGFSLLGSIGSIAGAAPDPVTGPWHRDNRAATVEELLLVGAGIDMLTERRSH